jgi:hypothetical protein
VVVEKRKTPDVSQVGHLRAKAVSAYRIRDNTN